MGKTGHHAQLKMGGTLMGVPQTSLKLPPRVYCNGVYVPSRV